MSTPRMKGFCLGLVEANLFDWGTLLEKGIVVGFYLIWKLVFWFWFWFCDASMLECVCTFGVGMCFLFSFSIIELKNRASLFIRLSSKESTCNTGDASLIPGLGRSPGGGNSNSLQYSCLESPWTAEPGGLQSMESQKSQTRLSN